MQDEIIKAINFVYVDCTGDKGSHIIMNFTDMKEPIMDKVLDKTDFYNEYGCIVGTQIKEKYEAIIFNSAKVEIIIPMDDMDKTDVEAREGKASKLANAITDCMINNDMTMQNLDEAVKIVEDVYRMNAILNRCSQ